MTNVNACCKYTVEQETLVRIFVDPSNESSVASD